MKAIKKTNFRWVIISLIFVLNFVNYIDRSSISYAVPILMKQFDFNADHIGMILGSFGIGYLIANFCSGFMADRFGPRPILLICTLVWGASICLTGAISGFLTAYIARFFLGLGEGANFPSVTRLVNNWLPVESRGKAFSNALVAVPISLAVGAPIVSLLLSYTGWRIMFVVLGIAIFVIWPLYFLFLKNTPSESPFVNKAELEFITHNRQLSKKSDNNWYGTLKNLLKNRTILSNNWSYFVFGYSMFFFLTWLPDFLKTNYHLNLMQVGYFSILPWLLGALLMWSLGYLSDYIFLKTNRLRFARTYPIAMTQLIALLCLIPIIIGHNITLTLICIAVAIACNVGNNGLFYAINIDVAKEKGATSQGVMNSGFALNGFLAPVITGFIVESTGSFRSVFILMAVLTFSALIIMLLFHHPDADR